jgi:hypothetical protein
MEAWRDMTEQEFISEAKRRGISDSNIKKTIDTFNMLRKDMPNITYDDLIDRAVKILDKIKNEPEGSITID